MNYFILRDGLQYGPYSRIDLQLYLRTGELFPGDLGRSEEINEWLPISRVLGTAVPPAPLSLASSAFGVADPERGKTGVMAFASGTRRLPPRCPQAAPPSLPWGILLFFTVLTCGLYAWFWSFVIARWVRGIDQRSKATPLLASSLVLCLTSIALVYIAHAAIEIAAVGALHILWIALLVSAMFSIRRSVRVCYLSPQNSQLVPSGVMTFFFGVIYFQFLFNRMSKPQSSTQVDLPRDIS